MAEGKANDNWREVGPANLYVVVIGCGGVLYHALNGIAIELAQMKVDEGIDEGMTLLTVDDGYVEEHNGLRQPWGPVGAIKADRAGTFLRERVRAAQDRFVVGREFRQVRIPDRNVTMALTATNRERYLWVVSPDNHKARFAALELVEEVAGHHLSEHRVVLAGNEFEGGQAMGFRRGFEGWDLHPLDIHPELEAVEGAPERPKEEGCAAMLGQSAESNILTGMCVRRAVHRMIGGASAVEEAWNANLATGEGKFWTIL